jgi:hypothetical protein
MASEYSVEMQKSRTQQFKDQLVKQTIAPNDHRSIFDFHDEKSLLHINHLDSGKIFRWKEDLTLAESALIQQKVEQWCEANHCNSDSFLNKM